MQWTAEVRHAVVLRTYQRIVPVQEEAAGRYADLILKRREILAADRRARGKDKAAFADVPIAEFSYRLQFRCASHASIRKRTELDAL